jgi:hypothetical protein
MQIVGPQCTQMIINAFKVATEIEEDACEICQENALSHDQNRNGSPKLSLMLTSSIVSHQETDFKILSIISKISWEGFSQPAK